MVNDIKESVFLFPPEAELKKLNDSLAKLQKPEVIKKFGSGILPCISWNHAKLLAAHGKTVMTGGGNYWHEYGDNQHLVNDIQARVKGDAAISAHTYCDYFWQ
jgi:phosphatidylserine/phosphatidylglycerophosphate/cardiolipin synthase-like enzyme